MGVVACLSGCPVGAENSLVLVPGVRVVAAGCSWARRGRRCEFGWCSRLAGSLCKPVRVARAERDPGIGRLRKPAGQNAEPSFRHPQAHSATATSCQGKTADEKKFLLKTLPSEKAQIKAIVAAVECFPRTQGSPDEVDDVQMASLNDLFGLYQASLNFYNLRGAPGPQANTSPPGVSPDPPRTPARPRTRTVPAAAHPRDGSCVSRRRARRQPTSSGRRRGSRSTARHS